MAPPKCGSTSIKSFVWRHKLEDVVLRLAHYQVVGDVYVVVRHPVERFKSLWKNKCRDGGSITPSVNGMSQVELFDFIESGVKNTHWTPQVILLGNKDAKLIPLNMFSAWWERSILSSIGELEKDHSTEGEVELSDNLKERILTFYADDVILYDQANEIQCL